MSTTRLNPSANGPLHLGHLYMAIVNEQYAHQSGGKFVVRLDDHHQPSLETMGECRTLAVARQMQTDLDWFGLNVDIYHYESEMGAEALKLARARFPGTIPDQPPLVLHSQETPWWVGGHSQVYPYTPALTAKKVVLDYLEGVDTLIRGVDLLTEVSLYSYYCEMMQIQTPRFIYLPRLKAGSGEISKTAGGHTIAELRAYGYRPQDLRDMLSLACLKNPANGWSLENIKEQPCL